MSMSVNFHSNSSEDEFEVVSYVEKQGNYPVVRISAYKGIAKSEVTLFSSVSQLTELKNQLEKVIDEMTK